MKLFLFYFAAIAWILSFIIHILTFADINLTKYFPIYILLIGIFIVWIPTIFNVRKNKDIIEYQSSGVNRLNPFGFYNILFKDTPSWLKWIAIGGFIYGIINFVFYFTSAGGVTGYQDGQYVLQNHGQIIKVLTEQEFYHYEALEARGISGHLLIFYGISVAILYPLNKENN